MPDFGKSDDALDASRARNRRIFLYFAPLTLLVTLVLPHGNLADVAVSFMLKDRLHASATQVSLFRLIVTLPLLASAFIGLARDHWNPLGRRDRGYVLIFAGVTAAIYAALGAARLSFAGLVAGILTANITMLFVNAAFQGLMALIGQENRMSGRLAVLFNTVSYVPVVGGAFLGGELAEHVSPGTTFFILAASALGLALFALWKPSAVFEGAYDKPAAQGGRPWRDLGRLLRTRAAYAPILLPFLYNFAPAFTTPLQFHVVDALHGSPSDYGDYLALYMLGFVPLFLLYGWLLGKVSFRVLLWAGVAVSAPNLAILFFIRTPGELLAWAAPMGALAAIGWCAMGDLAIRSCPKGLHGTLMLLVSTAGTLGFRFSDVLGAWLYDASPQNGFTLGLVISMASSFVCLPVILLIPGEVMRMREGVADPEIAFTTA